MWGNSRNLATRACVAPTSTDRRPTQPRRCPQGGKYARWEPDDLSVTVEWPAQGVCKQLQVRTTVEFPVLSVEMPMPTTVLLGPMSGAQLGPTSAHPVFTRETATIGTLPSASLAGAVVAALRFRNGRMISPEKEIRRCSNLDTTAS